MTRNVHFRPSTHVREITDMTAMRTFADKLLRPETVAIVGASGDVTKNNSRPQRYLAKHGYKGAVYPINPGRKELFGAPAYASIADCPTVPEHVYIMVPTDAVEEVVTACAKAGVAVATIFAGGFAEGGPEGRARQQRIVEAARAGGLRLIGPNSLGVVSPPIGLTLSANAVLERDKLPVGRTGLVSQSGGMIGALISRGQARGVGFSSLVSIGNECDLSVGEIADMMIDDPGTDVVLLFLETLRDPERVAAAARKAYEKSKPMVAYVLGRSDLGRKLAQSHTGAMVGEGSALDAFLRAHGVIRVDMFESLIEATALLAGRRPAKGKRVAVATTTGGAAALVADRLGERGIEVVTTRPELIAQLKPFRIDLQEAPIADLTMAGTKPEIVDTVMADFLADERVDAILMAVGSSAEFHPDLAVAPLAKWAKASKPVVSFLLPNAPRSLEMLGEAGIAGFRTPEACADVLSAYLEWRAPQAMDAEPVSSAVREKLSAARAAGGLNEQGALDVFAALGIATPRMAVIAKAGDVAGLDLSYPVVAKILSADIAHKSDVGGVIVGIQDAAALADAASRLLSEVPKRAPGAKIDGVVVQEMARGVGEAIVGFRRDPLVGPVIVVGMGGVLAEIYKDISVRPAPVGLDTAREMIAEVKGFAPMRGFRGLPEGDLEALAGVVANLSRLALVTDVRVLEAEINPVIVRATGSGAIAVDGLVVLSQ